MQSYRGAVIVIRSLANSNNCRPGASPFRATKKHCYTTVYIQHLYSKSDISLASPSVGASIHEECHKPNYT